jgi:pilus assembly protein Flp/PilA
MRFLNSFFQDDSGSNALEYGLIVAFVSLAVVASATLAGNALAGLFGALATKLTGVTTTVAGA